MKQTTAALAGILLAGALALSACGGGGRPTADELSKAMKDEIGQVGGDQAMTDKITDCLAKELVDSKLSDDTLRDLAEGKDTKDLSEEEQKVAQAALTEGVSACMKDVAAP